MKVVPSAQPQGVVLGTTTLLATLLYNPHLFSEDYIKGQQVVRLEWSCHSLGYIS